LAAQKNQLNLQIKGMEPEIKYMEALRDWRDGAIPWLDELYDLTARSPENEPGFRISQISIQPLNVVKSAQSALKADKDAKPQPTARISIQCTVPNKKDYLIFKLKDKINRDPHCWAEIKNGKVTGTTADQKLECTLQIDITRQLPTQYTTRLVLRQAAGKGPGGAE
jgi:hypothetical protein